MSCSGRKYFLRDIFVFARKFINIIRRKKRKEEKKGFLAFYYRWRGKKIVGGKKSAICHECNETEARYVVGRSTKIGLEDNRVDLMRRGRRRGWVAV